MLAGVLLCIEADSHGLQAALLLQVALVLGCFVLVHLLGIHGRLLWLRLTEENAYRLCFWLLFTPGLMGGFFPGIVHIALIPGTRRLPISIGALFGIPCLVIGLLVALRVYRTFGLDRFFYLYLFHPEEGEMAETEIFDFLRHPQYASFFYLCLGMILFRGSFEAVLLVIPFGLFGIGRILPEERELTARFGESYLAYKSRTPALIPQWRRCGAFFRYLVHVGE
jgi:protein-S-isoprenylcysteine O-methyltransferase Ste14